MDHLEGDDRYVINNSEATNRQYTIQSDYIYPLKNNRKLEAGIKGIFRRATSDFESMIRRNNVEDYKLNEDNTDYFRYNQDVYSAYGSYNFKLKKTSFAWGPVLNIHWLTAILFLPIQKLIMATPMSYPTSGNNQIQ